MEGLDEVNFQQPVRICETLRHEKTAIFQVCCFYLNIFFLPIRCFLKKTCLSPKFNKEKKLSSASSTPIFIFHQMKKSFLFFFALNRQRMFFGENLRLRSFFCSWRWEKNLAFWQNN